MQALFGNADYEDMYKGYLVYAGLGFFTAVGTDPAVNASYGCGTYNISSNPTWWKLIQDNPNVNIILMVDRNPEAGSGCTFSEKVYQAQLSNAGVVAVLIADTQDGTVWPTYMRADSLARSVNLPSMFVPKWYGDAIRSAALGAAATSSPYAIVIQLEFYLPNPDNRVEYDLYYNILNPKTMPFLTSYGNVARVFKQRAFFTPHWEVTNGTLQCTGSNPQSSTCAANCINTTTSKYYCLQPTSASTRGQLSGITGSQALNEVMRQQCIFNQTANNDTSICPQGGCQGYSNYYAWTFWSYLEQFYAQCTSTQVDPSYRFSQACSQQVVASMNSLTYTGLKIPPIDWSKVVSCSTPPNNADGTIPVLDDLINTWRITGPFVEPFLYINLTPYNGDVSCKTPITEDSCGILSAMCYGYENVTTGVNTYPIECNYPSNCPFGLSSCNGAVVTTTDSSGGISAGAVVGIVLAFLFIAGVVGYYFHKRSQDRTKAEVDALLKQYLPMDPGQTHGVAQGGNKLREQHERRLIQDMDLEDQELETTDEV